MTHRTAWHHLSIRLDSGARGSALGWWKGEKDTGFWVLDRVVEGRQYADQADVTDSSPVEVVVLPTINSPITKHDDGWECSGEWAVDLAHAKHKVDWHLHIAAEYLAIADHIQALPQTPTLAEDVVGLRAWITANASANNAARDALTRVLDYFKAEESK